MPHFSLNISLDDRLITSCSVHDEKKRKKKTTLLYYCLIFFLTAHEKRFTKRNMNKEPQNDYESNAFKTRTQLGFRNQEITESGI